MLRELVFKVIDGYIMNGERDVFARRRTRFENLRGRKMVVEWDDQKKLFKVSDPTGSIYVARKTRVRLQKMGVAARRKRVQKEYLGEMEIIRTGDAIIDCGANIGEFAIGSHLAGGIVHAFEPDPQEFSALQANASENMTLVNKALWHKTETLSFYDNNDSGDSSLIDTGKSKAILKIEAVRLDQYAEQANLTHIRLIKLEAEGAEPEILDGAGDVLERVDYIAVDMGPERGVLQENTVVAVVDRLMPRGFRLVHFDNKRFCGLFSRV